VDVNALLREQAGLLERTTLARVRVDLHLEPGLHPTLGDPGALAGAFMNLCVNAVDAIADQGTLTLRTRTLDREWIEVAVEDTGSGMTGEVMARAMDPFFTTKEVGKGTGLGLSMVYSAVKTHHGRLDIHSEPGRGTRVTVRLPRCQDGPGAEEPQAPAPAAAGTGRLVLVVDDDELIQASMREVLRVMGHRAEVAARGEEGLARLEGGLQPDLVILDMNMPGLGGAGTLPGIRALRPAVPVLLSTGRADPAAQALAAAHPGVLLVSKPFGLKELRQHFVDFGLG
jgi:CheY-like chemotaxis protein